jgi:hypothetical protein
VATVNKSASKEIKPAATNGPKAEDDHQLLVDGIIDNLKRRRDEGIPYTSIGHDQLLFINCQDPQHKRKQYAAQQKRRRNDRTGDTSKFAKLLRGFVILSDTEEQMLISDPTANHAVQEQCQAHVFAMATRIYWHMLREQENQVVVVRQVAGCSFISITHFISHIHLSITQRGVWFGKDRDGETANGSDFPLGVEISKVYIAWIQCQHARYVLQTAGIIASV